MADEERTVLLDGIEADLAGVDHVLARLDAGTYFTCEVCDGVLTVEQMLVDPTRTRCDACTG